MDIRSFMYAFHYLNMRKEKDNRTVYLDYKYKRKKKALLDDGSASGISKQFTQNSLKQRSKRARI